MPEDSWDTKALKFLRSIMEAIDVGCVHGNEGLFDCSNLACADCPFDSEKNKELAVAALNGGING